MGCEAGRGSRNYRHRTLGRDQEGGRQSGAQTGEGFALVDWQAAFVTRANGNAPLTAALGGQKVYWAQAPQGTARPYVVLTDVTEFRPQTLTDWDLEFARVQMDVWADKYTTVQVVMADLLAVLVPGVTNSNGHTFQRADVVLGPRDIPGETDGTTPLYRKTVDLLIAHR